jgi:hypothetical protein
MTGALARQLRGTIEALVRYQPGGFTDNNRESVAH